MMSEFALLASRRTVRWLDAASVLVVIGFAALGLFAGLELWGLARLHRALLDAAVALETTARAIGLLGDIPLIGGNVRHLAGEITRTAAQVRSDALAAREGVRVLAVVVGATIVLLALVPVAVVYLPMRLARRRELRELRRLLSGPVEPALIEHLATAAVRRLPYAELRRVSQHPSRDLERGDHTRLAAAELRRLGLPPPLGWEGDGA